ncbi:MAG TPA: hypothetical protein VFZ09_49840 [Archangium sp.]|uniref:hypothetical protein n=1 Tax=Archangium sp. TaxID=1872627 RepID=UPI002E3024DB|nr:hypothetical protein [Archangium sp.]HEX5754385.1 hypothetical protein [Archangium sp.]
MGLLDVLVRDRQWVMERHALWFVTGSESADSILPFIHGWSAHTHFNGGYDLAWQEFLDWYHDSQGEPLHRDWYVKPLRDCQGDHEKAALVLLDLVAGYVERFGLAPRGKAGALDGRIAATYGPLPREWGGRQVELVDALLWLRQRMHEGQDLSFLTGQDTVESLYCFTTGWIRNSVFNQSKDLTVEPFQDWLRDVKKEAPGEGWHVKYLQDCQGDHRKAALKFLDFAAEFRASR